MADTAAASYALQSYRDLVDRNITDTIRKIPSDVHMYWYTAEFGVSQLWYMPPVCKSVAY